MNGPAYIFFLFYQKYKPTTFQKEISQMHIGERDDMGFIYVTGFDKYQFTRDSCPFDPTADMPFEKILYVCREDDKKIDRKYFVDSVYYRDKTPSFTIFERVRGK